MKCDALPGCTATATRCGKCRRHYDQKRKGHPYTLVDQPRRPNPRSARTQVLAALQAVPTGLTRKQLAMAVVGGSVGLALVSLEEQGRVVRVIRDGKVTFQYKAQADG